jgi:hypothetical protein
MLLLLSLIILSQASWDWTLPGFDEVGSHNPTDPYITKDNIYNLSVKWTGQVPLWGFNQPSVVDEYVYVGDYGDFSGDGHFFAFNLTTGSQFWNKSIVGFVVGGSIVSGDNLYFCTIAAYCYNVNRFTGATNWLISSGAVNVWGSPLKIGNTLIIPNDPGAGAYISEEQFLTTCCSGSGSVVAVKANDGTSLWSYNTLEYSSSLINLTVPIPNVYQGLNNTSTIQYGPSGGGVWGYPIYSEDLGWVFACSGDGYTPMSNGHADPGVDSCFALDITTGQEKWHKSARLLRNDFDDWWNQALYFDPTAYGRRDADVLTPMLYKLHKADTHGHKQSVIAFGDKSGVWYVWDAVTGNPVNDLGLETITNPGTTMTQIGGFNIGPAFTKVQGEIVTFAASLTTRRIGPCTGSDCTSLDYASGTMQAHLYAFNDNGSEILGHFERNNTLFTGGIAITNHMLFVLDQYNKSLLIFDVTLKSGILRSPMKEIDLSSYMEGVGSLGSSITIANGYLVFGSGILGNPAVSQFIALSVF